MDGVSGRLVRLAVKAAADPPAGGNVHANPPDKTCQHADRSGNSKV